MIQIKDFSNNPLRFIYENWKGEINKRTVFPIEIWYGHTDYHTKDQWFLRAMDIDKSAERDFAIKDIIKFL
jgi:predicted DNA-binding transcriptional regulator YafY